jgi:hypothetical protein
VWNDGSHGATLLADGGDQFLIDFYQREVERLTVLREDLDARATAEEAEVARLQKEVDEGRRDLDPTADKTTRRRIARSIHNTLAGAEGVREVAESFGKSSKELQEHERRARELRKDAAAIDRTIGEYNAAIERLRQRRN